MSPAAFILIDSLFDDRKISLNPATMVSLTDLRLYPRLTQTRCRTSKLTASQIMSKARSIFINRAENTLFQIMRRLLCVSPDFTPQIVLLFTVYLASNNLLRSDKLLDVIRWIRRHIKPAVLQACFSINNRLMKAFVLHVFRVAIEIGDETLVRILLKTGLDPNLPTTSRILEKRPLQLAVENGYVRIAEILMHARADINQLCVSCKWGSKNLLEIAVETENTKLVQVLLDAGAQVNRGNAIPPFIETALFRAVRRNNYHISEKLINHGADINVLCYKASKPQDTRACLTAAIQTANLELVHLLLNNGANPNLHHVWCSGNETFRLITPLHAAAKLGRPDLIRTLLDVGADPHLQATDIGSPLRIAASVEGDKVDCVKTLLHASPVFQFLRSQTRGRDSYSSSPAADSMTQVHLNGEMTPESEMLCVSVLTDCDLALRDSAICGNIGVFSTLLATGANKSAVDIPCVYKNSVLRAVFREYGFCVFDSSAPEKEEPTIALVVAITTRNWEMVYALLDVGANINALTPGGSTALYEAVLQRNTSLIKLLLDRGADPNLHGNSPTLSEAAAMGDFQIVQLLLDYGASLNTPGDAASVLAGAVISDSVEILKFLLDIGAPVNSPSGMYPTALWIAAAQGKYEMVVILVANGAHIDVQIPLHTLTRTGRSQKSKTPLQVAITENNFKIFRFLLDAGANVNAPGCGPRDLDALQLAIFENNHAMIHALLEAGANVNSHSSRYCAQTAIHVAVQTRNIEIANLLLTAGCDVNAVTYGIYPQTALQMAAQNHDVDMVQILLEAGADVNAAPGWTYQSANIYNAFEWAQQNYPMTAIQFAIGGGVELLQILLNAGANVNTPAVGQYGKTALQRAACVGSVEEVQLLLKHSAEIGAPGASDSGGTALQLAARCGRIEIVSLLLRVGAMVNEQPSKIHGETALEGAAARGHLDITEMLINAAVTQKNIASCNLPSAENFARRNGHAFVADYLQEVRFTVLDPAELGLG